MRHCGWLALVGVVLAAAAAAAEDESKPLVLQIESFQLTGAKAENMQQAGEGKVVVFADKKSRAETTIRLPAGWHTATLYVWGASEDADSTFLYIEADDYDAGIAEMPVWTWEHRELSACNPLLFNVDDSQKERTIKLWTDEPGVKLDRLEIVKGRN